MNCKHSLKSLEDIDTLLAYRRDVAPDAAEGGRTSLAAEAPRNLLLHLEHPDVPFCQVVVEGHPEIVHEAQGLGMVLPQTSKQILGFGLLHTPSLWLGRLLGWRIGPFTCCEQLVVACFKLPELGEGQSSSLLGLITHVLSTSLKTGLYLTHQPAHLLSPLLLLWVRLNNSGQVTNQVGIAQAMLTLIDEVRTVGVVYRHSLKVGQDANLVHRLLAPLGVPGIVGQLRSRS